MGGMESKLRVPGAGPPAYDPESLCFSFVGWNYLHFPGPCWMQRMQFFLAPTVALLWKVGMKCLCLILLACIYFPSSANTPTLPENPPLLFLSVLVTPKGRAYESILANRILSPATLAFSGGSCKGIKMTDSDSSPVRKACPFVPVPKITREAWIPDLKTSDFPSIFQAALWIPLSLRWIRVGVRCLQPNFKGCQLGQPYPGYRWQRTMMALGGIFISGDTIRLVF